MGPVGPVGPVGPGGPGMIGHGLQELRHELQGSQQSDEHELLCLRDELHDELRGIYIYSNIYGMNFYGSVVEIYWTLNL